MEKRLAPERSSRAEGVRSCCCRQTNPPDSVDRVMCGGLKRKAELLCVRIRLWRERTVTASRSSLLTTLLLTEEGFGSRSRAPVRKRSCRGLRHPSCGELDLNCAHGTRAIDQQMASPEEFISWMLDEVYSWTWLPSDSLAARPTSGSNHGSRCWMASLITSLSLMTSSHLERSRKKKGRKILLAVLLRLLSVAQLICIFFIVHQ